MITIVDYGIGNMGSLANMLKRIGVSSSIETDPELLLKADKIILPGVGSFDTAMNQIARLPGLREVLNHKALKEQVPILGICLGMQLLTNSSEEGECLGLGWIDGSVKLFPQKNGLKVPHMGWNIAKPNFGHQITKNISPQTRYYFVHSYYVDVTDPKNSAMKTSYGLEFDSAITKENIIGLQFHPEKSHRFGMKILQNFCDI